MNASPDNRTRVGLWLIVVSMAVGLTYLFWRPLWHGAGLVGGDIYTYYLPQKAFYADRLQEGDIPLWNPLVGHGYPTVAESQTGVFYPPNLLLHRWLDVNAAFNVSLLAHFAAGFVAAWLLARRMGLGFPAALLAAMVFVYSWFPPRIVLEWAVIGAVYFPLTLWCVESYLQSHRRAYLVGLSVAVGVHLLAGHFNLAFIEVLTCLAYAVWRAGQVRRLNDQGKPATTSETEHSGRGLSAVVLALGLGFALAAAQLLPTWELKQLSQRAQVGAAHDPGYGHIPPWYLSQVVAPWLWYAPEVDADQALRSIRVLSFPSLTNKIEAHLYFGLLPLALAVGGVVYRYRSREGTPQRYCIWGWLGLAAVVYATGWLIPLTRHAPGFNFFMGPGRYGIITTMAVALLGAYTLDRWLSRRRGIFKWGVFAVVLAVTAADLWIVRVHWNRTEQGAPAWYADWVADPPITHRDESPVRWILAEHPEPVRLFGTFQNAPTLTGFAMTPPYLGLGPAEYYDPALTMPRPQPNRDPTIEDVHAQVHWLQQAGVTHILSEQPLSTGWPVQLVWQGFDPMLSAAAARREPYFLYELQGTRGRVAAPDDLDCSRLRVVNYLPERVVIETDCEHATTVTLTDLFYPSWRVTVDQQPARPLRVDGMFRGVNVPPGAHTITWSYEPTTLRWGGVITLFTLAGLILWSRAWPRKRAGSAA